MKTLEAHKQEVNDLQAMLLTGDSDNHISADEIQILLEEAQQHSKSIQNSILTKRSRLSVDN